MVAVLELSESVMNANLTFAASVVPAPLAAPPRRASGSQPASITLKTFDVYRVSLSVCQSLAVLGPFLNSALRDQLNRASSSVVLNIAEGFGSRSRGVKRRHYEIARGSAVECVAITDLAVAFGTGDAEEWREARELLGRVAAMLAKLEARFR